MKTTVLLLTLSAPLAGGVPDTFRLDAENREVVKAYNMARRVVAGNIEPWKRGLLLSEKPALMAGKGYASPWTRDASYNTYFGCGLIHPEVARNTLLSVLIKEGETGQERLNMPERLFHMERTLFSRIPLRPGQLQALYWGTPIAFSEADFPRGLLEGDIMRLHFSGGIGLLENRIASLPVTDQLRGLNDG